MKSINPFFKKKNPILLSKIVDVIKPVNLNSKKKYINDIKEINDAKKNEITFLNSSKYSNLAINMVTSVYMNCVSYVTASFSFCSSN